jgi:hypothetical protein
MAHEADTAHAICVQDFSHITKEEVVTAADVIEFSEFMHMLAQTYPEAAASPLWADMVEPVHAEAGKAIGVISRLMADFREAGL